MKPRPLRSAERVLRELVRAQDKLLICYRLGDPDGGRHVDRILRLRDVLEDIDSAAQYRRDCAGIDAVEEARHRRASRAQK